MIARKLRLVDNRCVSILPLRQGYMIGMIVRKRHQRGKELNPRLCIAIGFVARMETKRALRAFWRNAGHSLRGAGVPDYAPNRKSDLALHPGYEH